LFNNRLSSFSFTRFFFTHFFAAAAASSSSFFLAIAEPPPDSNQRCVPSSAPKSVPREKAGASSARRSQLPPRLIVAFVGIVLAAVAEVEVAVGPQPQPLPWTCSEAAATEGVSAEEDLGMTSSSPRDSLRCAASKTFSSAACFFVLIFLSRKRQKKKEKKEKKKKKEKNLTKDVWRLL